MRYLSLFTGIAGIDAALDAAGMECAGQCEIDRHATRVLARHWPGVPRWGDITKVTHDEIAAVGPVDLVAGGTPCQDLSVAGRRAGLAGERSGLWWQFLRVVERSRPRFVLWENVPGALSSNGGRDFAIILRSLAERGYRDLAWRVLDAQYFRVAQRRRRVFLVASAGGRPHPGELLFESGGVPGSPPSRRAPGEAVAGTLGGGAGSRGWPDDPDRMTFVPVISPAVVAKWAKGSGGPSGDEAHNLVGQLWAVQDAAMLRDKAQKGIGVTAEGPMYTLDTYGAHGIVVAQAFEARFARNRSGAPAEIAPPLKAENGTTGKGDGAPLVMTIGRGSDPLWTDGVAQPITGRNGDPGHVVLAWDERNITSAANRSRVDTDSPAPTLHTDGGRVAVIEFDGVRYWCAVRRLTPVECLRLQGIPDWWLDGLGLKDSAKYRLIGNSVAVPVVRWIAGRIVMALRGAA